MLNYSLASPIVSKRAPGVLEVYYFPAGLHVRTQNWDGLQWEYLFTHNHNTGYEPALHFLLRRVPTKFCMCWLIRSLLISFKEGGGTIWTLKRGLREFLQRQNFWNTKFFRGSIAQLYVTNGINSVFPLLLSMLAVFVWLIQRLSLYLYRSIFDAKQPF